MRLWLNTKFMTEDDLFIVNSSNKKYLREIIDKGYKYFIPDNYKEYIKNYYKEKIDDLILIGITGTNGKTTTCYLIYQLLNLMGIKTSYIGTIGFYIKDKVYNLDNTTPSMDVLYNLLDYSYDLGCKVVVMEVSSHALKQDRVYGLLFDAIALTNITQDHLDYHKTKKDYINSKKLLVKKLKNKRICVINKCKYYKKFLNKDNNNYIIGKDVQIKKIKINNNETIIYIKDKNKYIISLNLVGKFNVLNYLIAYKILKELDFNALSILNNSYKILEPRGRMEKIIYKNNVIFIDYAHTPDAVKKVLTTVKNINNNGIITIIGCGGNRDKEKRSIMGKISCKYSDYVIFTNDNPRFEDEKDIMQDILVGARGNYEVIYDRKEAIKRGIDLLKENMILMILGKGHENYQIIGNKKVYFSDYETVKKIIDK